jgi:hypothetical protein
MINITFLDEIILKLLLSVLTVILLREVIEKFSSKFISNNSILFLPALIVTFSKTEVFF